MAIEIVLALSSTEVFTIAKAMRMERFGNGIHPDYLKA